MSIVRSLTAARLARRSIRTLARSEHTQKEVHAGSSRVRNQLVRMGEMMKRVGEVNSPEGKVSIVSEYPDLKDLLQLVYDPKTRFKQTSPAFSKRRQELKEGKDETASKTQFTELVDVFRYLAESPTGDRDVLAKFALAHLGPEDGISNQHPDGSGIDPMRVLEKILDRHLSIGLKRSILNKVDWTSNRIDGMGAGQNSHSLQTTSPKGQDKAEEKGRSTEGIFECALGKTILPPFEDLQKSKHGWYASRKLDGVRVLSLIDFRLPKDLNSEVKIENIDCVSRHGNSFESLDRLKEQLILLERYPHIRGLLDRDDKIISGDDKSVVKRLVLDGEICVMVPQPSTSLDNDKEEVLKRENREKDDGTGASAIWENDGLVEDFTEAVSQVKRKSTMSNPLYFIFDMISWSEASTASSSSIKQPKTFGERIGDTKSLVDWLRSEVKSQGMGEPKVRMLVQWRVVEREDIEGMVKRALEEGWEGLIFRADTLYKGKRTKDIRKFKQFQEAEYEVIGYDTSQMRLSVNGVFGEYKAVSNIVIKHKCQDVSVGSGFTAAERIAYAEDPKLIMGKQVTVQYFSESDSGDRGTKSLRFPSVKKVWTEGKRDI